MAANELNYKVKGTANFALLLSQENRGYCFNLKSNAACLLALAEQWCQMIIWPTCRWARHKGVGCQGSVAS